MPKNIFEYALKTGSLIKNKKSNIVYKLRYKNYWEEYIAISQKIWYNCYNFLEG